MKWIKYEYVCGTDTDGAEILAKKRIGYSESNLAIAEAEAYNGEYTIEEDDKEYQSEAVIPANADMQGNRITNLGDPVDDTDAASKKTLIDYALGKDSLVYVIVSEFPELELRNTAKIYCIPIEGKSNYYQAIYYSDDTWITSESVYVDPKNFEVVSASELNRKVSQLTSEVDDLETATTKELDELSSKTADYDTLTLGYGTDGKLYIYKNKKPIGTGIGIVGDETVSGTINEDNNLIFNDNIADGDYTLYFLTENNEYSDAMNMVVSEIVVEEEVEIGNLIPTLVDTDLTTIYNGIGYKEGVRISVSAGGETTADGVLLTGLIPLGNDGDVFHIRGVANVTSDSVSETCQGGYWCYDVTGKLLNTVSGIPVIPTSCIGYDENGDYTITMTHSAFSLLDGTAFIRFQFGLSTGEVIMTRNKLITNIETDTETDILGVNLLTSGDYTITLNKRYSGSSKAYISVPGMIAFMIPMEQVLNRRIRFTGFEYGVRVTESQPLWFTLDSNQNSLGYLTGTDANTGIWGSAYLTQEDDGSCTLPINSNTIPTDGAVTLVINMVVDSAGTTITAIPDTMSIVIEEDV